MATRKVVVVTGANRGIGLAICETILKSNYPVTLYACSRAGVDLKLTHPSNSQVNYPTLDITQSSQVEALASDVTHIDVLINNAGLNRASPNSLKDAKEIMQINYHGTLRMCQTFLPLMNKGGRIVNVSSVGSSLHVYPKDLQARFRDASASLSDVDALATEYLESLESGNTKPWGPRASAYSVSKACVNAMTGALAKENAGVSINCCCPGWVDTEMGNIVGKPSKTPEQGAKIPVKLATGDIDGVTGKYWENASVHDTGDGRVAEW